MVEAPEQEQFLAEDVPKLWLSRWQRKTRTLPATILRSYSPSV
jgi:hypothetical protein